MTWENFVELIRLEIPDRQMAEEVEILPESRLIEDLGYDSLAVVELLSQMEQLYDIDYTMLDNFSERFNVCGDIFEGMKELMGK